MEDNGRVGRGGGNEGIELEVDRSDCGASALGGQVSRYVSKRS